MTAFRLLLVLLFGVLMVYTGIVIISHGMGLLGVFFGDITQFAWPGQFNLDFMMMLILSGMWTSWRHHFSGKGLLLGFLALTGGALFLTVYLFIISLQANGDMREILLGRTRVDA